MSLFELTLGLRDTEEFEIVTVAATPGPLAARYEAEHLPLIIDSRVNPATASVGMYEEDLAALGDFLGMFAPDLVYANTIDRFAVIDAARLRGLPSVWNIRESEPWRIRLADRHAGVAARAAACFGYATEVIFVAESSRREWSRFQGGRARFSLIANALRPGQGRPPDGERARDALKMAPHERLLLNVGTLCPRKGQVDLAKALDRLLAAGAPVRLACVGNDHQAYSREMLAACSPEAQRRITFTGVLGEVADYYAAADVYVCSSRSEAFPRTLLEAACASAPIVTTPVDGISEVFKDGDSALFYAPGDAEGLATRVAQVLSDEGLRGRLAAAAAPWVLQSRHNYERMVESYAEVIWAALRNAAGPQAASPALQPSSPRNVLRDFAALDGARVS